MFSLLQVRFWICFLFFLNVIGCAVKAPVAVFDQVPAGKTTGSASRFLLIDDFNAGVGRTRLGTEWKVRESDGERLKLAADHEDAIKYGGAASAEYKLGPGESAGIIAPLGGLDASRTQYLAFLVRRSELEGFHGTVAVGLKDQLGAEALVEAGKSRRRPRTGPFGEWVEVAIPRSAFGALDFNQLDELQIVLRDSGSGAEGKITFDEIALYGPDEMVFESDRDNLVGFPHLEINESRREKLLRIQDDRKFTAEVARDTWRYLEHLIDKKTHLVVDHIRVGAAPGVGSYVSPTNLALYWIANIAAYDLSLISREEAVGNIETSLTSLEAMERWERGPWYNFYHSRSLRITRRYVSVVDNGWLAAAFVLIRQAFPESFAANAEKNLKKLNFYEFYDASNGQLKLGYDADKKLFAPYHYGLLATEARLTSYVAVGKGDLDPDHWARIYRTLPVEWDWQKQVPEGGEQTLFGLPVFEGHYTYLNRKFVPSWGGSLFEFLAPTLLLKEQELAPKGLGKNNEIVTDLHIEHALRIKGYPVWGIAPCAVRNGRYWIYREYGIPELGAKGYPDRGVIAPYVSFLALATRPEAAVRNLRKMLMDYPDLYGEYGFYDSVDVGKGIVNHQYLILDQAISFIAIANFVKDGAIRNRFHSDPIGQKGEALLRGETFSVQ